MEGNEENVIVGWELEWGDGKREALAYLHVGRRLWKKERWMQEGYS